MAIHSTEVIISNTPLTVDGSATTQPVSATSLPLPSNASQETGGHLASIDTKLTDGSQKTQVTGTVSVLTANAASSTVSQITVNTTNQTILAANVNRKKVILFAASSIVFIKLGALASATSFTYKVTANSTTIEITGWTGQIDAITSAGNSIVNVTELV